MDRCRQRLHEQDLPADGDGAVDAGDDDAGEEEDLDARSRRAQRQTPGQAGGEEAVVEALVVASIPSERRCLGGRNGETSSGRAACPRGTSSRTRKSTAAEQQPSRHRYRRRASASKLHGLRPSARGKQASEGEPLRAACDQPSVAAGALAARSARKEPRHGWRSVPTTPTQPRRALAAALTRAGRG